MPTLETMDLMQKAVLWAAAGNDDHGEITVSNRVEIDCRWVLGKTQSVDAQGNLVAYDGGLVVDQEIAVNGILYRGSEESLPEDVGSATDLELYQVKGYREGMDLKGRSIRRTLMVQRYRGAIPTIV